MSHTYARVTMTQQRFGLLTDCDKMSMMLQHKCMQFMTAFIIRTALIIFVNFTILSICSLKEVIGNLIIKKTHMPLSAIVQDASLQLKKDVRNEALQAMCTT